MYTEYMAKTSSLPISITQALSASWELFKKNWPLIVGVMLVSMFGSNLVDKFIQEMFWRSPIAGILKLVMSLVAVWVQMVMMFIFLKIVRKQKVTTDGVMSTVGSYVNYLITAILYGLMVAVGMIFLIVPGVYLALKYGFALIAVVDKNVSFSKAFAMSAKMTQGRMMEFLIFAIAMILVSISGVLALGVGVIVTSALASLSFAMLYDKLAKGSK